MTITSVRSDKEERRVRQLQNRVATIAREYGWDPNSPKMRALAADDFVLENYEEDRLRQLLDPNGPQNISKSKLDRRLLILAPFDRKVGPSPIDIAERHLPDGWQDQWTGIVVEGTSTAFLDQDGREIIRFNDAGCGNGSLIVDARYVIGHHVGTFLPHMSHCSVMAALKEAAHDNPYLGKRGLSYGPLLFVRRGEEWERQYC